MIQIYLLKVILKKRNIITRIDNTLSSRKIIRYGVPWHYVHKDLF